MVVHDLEVDVLVPDLSRSHVLSHVVECSLEDLLALLFVLISHVLKVNSKLNESFPELDLGRVVPQSFLVPA